MANNDKPILALSLFNIANRDALRSYAIRYRGQIESHGGNVLVIGRFKASLAGDLPPRVALMLVEWPSKEVFDAFRNDPALAQMHQDREKGVAAPIWHLFDRIEDLREFLP